MDISFLCPKLESICASEQTMTRKLGDTAAHLIKRLIQLDAAPSLYELLPIGSPPFYLRAKIGRAKDLLSISIDQSHDLIFKVASSEKISANDDSYWTSITEIQLVEVRRVA